MNERDEQAILTKINDLKRLERVRNSLEYAVQEYVKTVKICTGIDLKFALIFNEHAAKIIIAEQE